MKKTVLMAICSGLAILSGFLALRMAALPCRWPAPPSLEADRGGDGVSAFSVQDSSSKSRHSQSVRGSVPDQKPIIMPTTTSALPSVFESSTNARYFIPSRIPDMETLLHDQTSSITGKYEVHVTHDGKEGLKLAKRLSPDAILLDIEMPKMHGMEVLKELKALGQKESTPLVMVMWHPESGPVDNAVYNYAEQFLVKPISTAHLTAILERLLAASRPAHPVNKPVEKQKGSANAAHP